MNSSKFQLAVRFIYGMRKFAFIFLCKKRERETHQVCTKTIIINRLDRIIYIFWYNFDG